MKPVTVFVLLCVMVLAPGVARASEPGSGIPAQPNHQAARTAQDEQASARPALGGHHDVPLETLLADVGASRAATPESGRVRESPAAYSVPVGDPNDRFTTSARPPLSSNGLDKVVVKFDGLPPSRPVLVAALTPDLAPASAIEVRRAFGELLWKPSVEQRETQTEATLLFHLEH